ncbi:MAG: MCE family protein [Kiritimatiellae bacterium]|nr:MCE family protein [Kiritimatiellia bacterium]
MSRKRSNAFSEFVTGLFMLVVLALLAYFTIVISGVDLIRGRERIQVRIMFDGVGGLKDHDNVMYRGTKVGTVEDVILTETNLVAVVEIDKSVVLRTGYRACVQSMSLLGGNHLVLEEGEGEIITLGEETLRGETPSDWMKDITEVAKNLKNLTGDKGVDAIVTNLKVMSEKVRDISERVERGEGTLGRLMSSDDTLYNDIQSTVKELRETAANANVIAARLANGEGTLGRMMSSDDTLYNDIHSTVTELRETAANANIISTRLVNGEGPLGRLLSEDETVLEDLKGAIAAFRKSCESFDVTELKEGATDVVNRAGTLIDSLNVVADRLKNGEGTLGRLAADDTLYKEVEGLVRDIRQVIDNYRDTTPISTFSSLATGAL